MSILDVPAEGMAEPSDKSLGYYQMFLRNNKEKLMLFGRSHLCGKAADAVLVKQMTE